MKTLPAFAKFDRQLAADIAETRREENERLGIEEVAPRRRGRPPKAKPVVERKPKFQVAVQPELGDQIAQIAAALGSEPLAIGRMILGAGVEAVVRELEVTGKITVPLRLDVMPEGRGYYYQHVRTVTPERFESLRHLHSQRLSKWKAIRELPHDKTGVPMPPPKPPALNR